MQTLDAVPSCQCCHSIPECMVHRCTEYPPPTAHVNGCIDNRHSRIARCMDHPIADVCPSGGVHGWLHCDARPSPSRSGCRTWAWVILECTAIPRSKVRTSMRWLRAASDSQRGIQVPIVPPFSLQPRCSSPPLLLGTPVSSLPWLSRARAFALNPNCKRGTNLPQHVQ